jgi:hypothetical protein
MSAATTIPAPPPSTVSLVSAAAPTPAKAWSLASYRAFLDSQEAGYPEIADARRQREVAKTLRQARESLRRARRGAPERRLEAIEGAVEALLVAQGA